MEENKLFKDFVQPDISFLNHIQFDKKDIVTKDDADKATREYNTLKRKMKEMETLHQKWQKFLTALFQVPSELVSATEKEIYAKIVEYALKNDSEVKFDTVGGKTKGSLVLEHSEVEIIKIVRIKPHAVSKNTEVQAA